MAGRWVRAVGLCAAMALGGCGFLYNSPQVRPSQDGDVDVQVVRMTPETVARANLTPYHPRPVPAVFNQTAGTSSGARGAQQAPAPVLDPVTPAPVLETRMPPAANPGPYRIGVGDVLQVSSPDNRQTYAVQDDGSIAVPDVGRVQVAGQTLAEAEETLFQRLVRSAAPGNVSLEIAAFNARSVAIGGAVSRPVRLSITQQPLYLDEALVLAGEVSVSEGEREFTSVRLYRDGTLYQIPLERLLSGRGTDRVRLVDEDIVFVDQTYSLDRAQAYFEEQILLGNFRQQSLATLRAEIDLRRAELEEARANYRERLELFDAVPRDYVFLTGEVGRQGRYILPFGRVATLAEALYTNQGIPTETGNVREIYVLRAASSTGALGPVTAYQLDARNAVNLLLTTRFEMRPNDIVFVAEQPVTRINRVIRQVTPFILTTITDNIATN